MSNKMSKSALDISENETEFSKKIKLELKLISVSISNKHPEIDIDHEIQNFLLILNLFLETELNEDSLNTDGKDGIPDILITIATKLLEHLHNNIDLLNLLNIIKGTFRKLKSFIVKYKKDGENNNDRKNSAGPETSSGKGEGKSKASNSS